MGFINGLSVKETSTYPTQNTLSKTTSSPHHKHSVIIGGKSLVIVEPLRHNDQIQTINGLSLKSQSPEDRKAIADGIREHILADLSERKVKDITKDVNDVTIAINKENTLRDNKADYRTAIKEKLNKMKLSKLKIAAWITLYVSATVLLLPIVIFLTAVVGITPTIGNKIADHDLSKRVMEKEQDYYNYLNAALDDFIKKNKMTFDFSLEDRNEILAELGANKDIIKNYDHYNYNSPAKSLPIGNVLYKKFVKINSTQHINFVNNLIKNTNFLHDEKPLRDALTSDHKLFKLFKRQQKFKLKDYFHDEKKEERNEFKSKVRFYDIALKNVGNNTSQLQSFCIDCQNFLDANKFKIDSYSKAYLKRIENNLIEAKRTLNFYQR